MKQPDSISYAYIMAFKESVRGLSVGAPVDFRGLIVGEVTGINMEVDSKSKEVNMLVEVRTYPERIRARQVGAIKQDPRSPRFLTDQLIEKGLRAQLKSGSIVTGQLYRRARLLPQCPEGEDQLGCQPAPVPDHTQQPGGTAGNPRPGHEPSSRSCRSMKWSMNSGRRCSPSTQTLQSTNSAIKRVDGEVLPEVRTTLEEARKTLGAARQNLDSDAPLQQDLRETLRELGRAAQSLRTLTEYLERHPESLIRGKSDGKGE